MQTKPGSAEAGDSACGNHPVARFAGSIIFNNALTWGLRPRLYAYARFAGSGRSYAFALPGYRPRAMELTLAIVLL